MKNLLQKNVILILERLHLAKMIQTSSLNCASFMENCNSTQAESTLTVNELKEAFFSLKINKSPGYDDISINVVRNCFGP